MQMTIQEGSNYFRGLLLLIRKDHQVTNEEITLMMRVGKSLGFAKDFCETAIADILENKYILDKPPVFSQLEIAKKFITHGLIIGHCDHKIHPNEERWLQLIAEANEINNDWFMREQQRIDRARENNELDFDDLVVEYLK
ncbi:MAG: hypothetical protein Q8L88_04400 [Bacteroidota bacterium]|nr:hypothetical protein [Bacteroidota bacterium]